MYFKIVFIIQSNGSIQRRSSLAPSTAVEVRNSAKVGIFIYTKLLILRVEVSQYVAVSVFFPTSRKCAEIEIKNLQRRKKNTGVRSRNGDESRDRKC